MPRATMLAPDTGLEGELVDDEVSRTVTFTPDAGAPYVLAYEGKEVQIIRRLMPPRLATDMGYFTVHGDLAWFTRPGDVWYHDAGPKPATRLGFTIAGRDLQPGEEQLPRTFASERGLGDVLPEFS